jgi:hypothetical protein
MEKKKQISVQTVNGIHPAAKTLCGTCNGMLFKVGSILFAVFGLSLSVTS